MGLDWHAVIRMTKEEKIEWINEHCKEELATGKSVKTLLMDAPKWQRPCQRVNAPKMKDRPDFEDYCKNILKERKEDAEKEKARGGSYNKAYVEHWESMTLEKFMEEIGDKWDCENCPLLKALKGADSTGNPFIGLTVSSCDFRGKRISADAAIDDDLRNEAYEEKSPAEMFEYANALEAEIERLRNEGELIKESYEKYSEEYDNDPYPFKKDKMSREEYEKAYHWREQNLRDAIHWLRTCATHKISMVTSY